MAGSAYFGGDRGGSGGGGGGGGGGPVGAVVNVGGGAGVSLVVRNVRKSSSRMQTSCPTSEILLMSLSMRVDSVVLDTSRVSILAVRARMAGPLMMEFVQVVRNWMSGEENRLAMPGGVGSGGGELLVLVQGLFEGSSRGWVSGW